MNCNIIKDLIPLYIDDCCSEETASEVKKHINECDDCKKVFKNMTNDIVRTEKHSESKKYSKINDWKASVIQSVLFLLSFLFITAGVYFEASTDYHDFNGLAAFYVVVPATGFLLSLTNWYFVKLYPSRKVFSWCSCILSVVITACATVWCSFHYDKDLINVFSFILFAPGTLLTVIFAAVSKILSAVYAKMLGKE